MSVPEGAYGISIGGWRNRSGWCWGVQREHCSLWVWLGPVGFIIAKEPRVGDDR